jgi:putative membrane-bound dehydrogenase-like protein
MHSLKALIVCLAVTLFISTAQAAGTPPAPPRTAGVASVDITPDGPIRLSGFAVRTKESEGVRQKLWAKALAIGDGGQDVSAVLIAVDNLGVPDHVTREVAKRLHAKKSLDPSRLTVTSTHTHSGPMLTGALPTMFGKPMADEETKRVDAYTQQLTDKLEQAALGAIADLKAATLEFGIGSADFAINRRQKGGVVDHDLPVLAVRDPDGTLRAVYTSYACHCVVFADNQVSGDWAGYVQEMVEKNHPGAVALTSVGCGGDSNPAKRDSVEAATSQAKQIADEVDRLLKRGLTPVTAPLATTLNRIDLPFDKHPTREQWEQVAKQQDYAGYHARFNLAKLDRGEKLQTEISYPIQTWAFGDQLAVVFLAGEVVVDYSLRLKNEFDRTRMWVNGYSNDVPCYIPSERVLKEGGYEGAGAMIFYDRPTKFAPGLEQKIVDEVHRQVPKAFVAPKGTEGTAPRSPQASLKSIRTKPGLEVELVVAEPLVTSPVAIDWDAAGRMWVCEMHDYPTGSDNNWQPGGRVKVLEDTDHDGAYDRATVVLSDLPFPTGVTAWGDGVLVSAAPDILYARYTAGDAKAVKVEKLFTGFMTGNFQARVNSLALGLDNWIYGANGLLGGEIAPAGNGKGNGEKLDISNHDFRFKPINGPMELATGLTQQGRVRDDWGRWFGCNNSEALRFYPYEQRYLARNPNVPTPPVVVSPAGDYDVARIYPISRGLERFNNPESANRVTSGCGLGLYRDTLLGDAYYGNAFLCEPVHNVVMRMLVDGDGQQIKRRRADDERDSEFYASEDNWSRPVQARMGPDGALYVVDMYRFLIEHPRWIQPDRLSHIDIRAGADKGRIYRIKPAGKPLREVRDLNKLRGAELANALDTANGTERDRVHIALLLRHDGETVTPLKTLAKNAKLPQVRLQALCVLDGLGELKATEVEPALKDADAQVRVQAIRLCERLLQDVANEKELGAAVLAMSEDASPLVQRQLAYTLGEWKSGEAGNTLAKLAAAHLDDAELRTAVLSSSAGQHCGDVLAAVMAADAKTPGRGAWVAPLVATAAASSDESLLGRALLAVLPQESIEPGVEQFRAAASLLDAMQRRKLSPAEFIASRPDLAGAGRRLEKTLAAARSVAADAKADAKTRVAALALVGRGAATPAEIEVVSTLAASADSDAALRDGALSALGRQSDASVAAQLLKNWKQTSPAARPAIIRLLLSRDEWASALLDGVRKKVVAVPEVSLEDRQRLAASSSESIRKAASELFPTGSHSDKVALIKKYQAEITAAGDATKGAAVFAANCAACHLLNGVGHAVGPDLANLRDRDAGFFIQNVLDPGAIVEPRFANYQVVMKDRRVLSGLITSETAGNLTLTGGNGAAETVARADVKDIRVSPLSMMPEGLEAAMTPAQMADLIAFLKAGAGSRKRVDGNEPAPVAAARSGAVVLPASKAEIYGSNVTFEPEFGNIGWWHGATEYVAWTAKLAKAGDVDVWLDYACAAAAAGNAFTLEVGGASLKGTVAGTGPDWSGYKQVKVGTVRVEPGTQRVTLRPTGEIREALMDLRAVALVAAGAPPAWPKASAANAKPSDGVMRDAASVAKFILDPANSNAAREAAVNSNPQFAAELVTEMTKDMPVGTPAAKEYERIPWIWRVAIACGRRNDAGELRRLIAVSLPATADAPLRDWQAVVIGGGVINGLTQHGVWPGERIAEIIGTDAKLKQGWDRAIELSKAMADDTKVRPGTRYDALRMLGVLKWEQAGDQLKRYLSDANAELQMGAVSGIGDVNAAEATSALIGALPSLKDHNRVLAVDALLRDAGRATALLDAIKAGKIEAKFVNDAQRKRLLENADETVAKRAAELFPK